MESKWLTLIAAGILLVEIAQLWVAVEKVEVVPEREPVRLVSTWDGWI